MPQVSVSRVVRPLVCAGLPAALAVLSTLVPLNAQTVGAALTGVVADESGAVVAKVRLTLADPAQGVQRTATSDNQGHYVFAGMPAGTYVLTAGSGGFAPIRIDGVVLADGDQRSLPVTLQVAPVADAVTVRAGLSDATRSASGTKTETSLLETPRSISVISAAQIEAQRAGNIDEVLRYASGVASEFRGIDRSRTDITLRGFNWSGFVFTDGMRGGVGAYGELDVDPFGLERVEVLRGPASILYGAASPGGLVNVVTKRPTETFFADTAFDVGSFNQFGGRFDVGGSVTDNRTVLARITGVIRGGDSQVDFVRDSRVFLAPALTWRPRTDTSLTFLGTYQKDDAPWAIFLPAEGTVLPNPNGRIPTSRHLGEANFIDRFHRSFLTPSYLLTHRLTPAWTLSHGLRYGRYKFHALSVSGGELLEDVRTVARYPWIGHEDGHGLTTDSNVQANLRSGRVSHRVLLGFDYKRSSATEAYGYTEGPPLDIFSPVYGATLPTDVPLYQDDDQDAFQAGVYAQDQVKAGRWVLNLSGRYDKTQTETFDRLSDTRTVQRDAAFTGQVGIVYLLGHGFAPFANYAESFEPQAGTDSSGQAFVPTTGTQYEAGLKYQPAGSESIVTMSAFVIRQQNVQTSDPLDPRFNVQTGEVRSRGLDIDARTVLPGNVNLMASFGFAGTAVTKSNGDDLGNRVAQTPRSVFSLWVDHAVRAGRANGLRVSAGVRRNGSTLDYANEIEVPGVTLMDAGAAFDVKGDSRGLGVSLNVSNLLDKAYVASCEGLYWCMYGPRRTITASVRHRW